MESLAEREQAFSSIQAYKNPFLHFELEKLISSHLARTLTLGIWSRNCKITVMQLMCEGWTSARVAVISLQSRITWDYPGTVFFYGKQKINLTKSTTWNVTWISLLMISQGRCGSCGSKQRKEDIHFNIYNNIWWLNFSAVLISEVTAENKLVFAKNHRYATYFMQTDRFSPSPVVLWW